MTQLERRDVKKLLESGLATGTIESFTVPKIAKTKEEKRAEIET